MACHKEEVIVKINIVIFTGLILNFFFFLVLGMSRDCCTALMQEMLRAPWIVNSGVILYGCPFLGKN